MYNLPDCDINIDELLSYLMQFLEENVNWQTPKRYTITEYFAKCGMCTYELYNLIMEYEDGIVFCSDAEEVLLENNTYVLNGFLTESVIYVGFQKYETMITLSFDDGYIRICY